MSDQPLIRYVRLTDGRAFLTIATPAQVGVVVGASTVAEIRLATSADVAHFESNGVPRPAGGRIKGNPQ